MALPTAEGGRPGKSGPNWLLLGGLGLGGVVLLTMMFRGGSTTTDGKTTAAGGSINAALGSLQEYALNILGAVGAAAQESSAQHQAIQDKMDANQKALLDNLGNLSDDVKKGMGEIQDHLTTSDVKFLDELASVNKNVIAGNAAIGGVAGNVANLNQLVQGMTASQKTQFDAIMAKLGGISNTNATMTAYLQYLIAMDDTYLPDVHKWLYNVEMAHGGNWQG